MSASDSVPATPEDWKDQSTPGSPGSEDSSEPSTPLESPGNDEPPRRLPSLRSVSDPRNMNPNSTVAGMLGKVRGPVQTSASYTGNSSASVANSIMEKARQLHQDRLKKGNPASPAGQLPTPSGSNGFSSNIRPPQLQQRPHIPQANSAPTMPSIKDRRLNMMGMNLSNMGGPSPATTTGKKRGPPGKLSDITGDAPSNRE
jgi:mitogen-activated protein kinase kinase